MEVDPRRHRPHLVTFDERPGVFSLFWPDPPYSAPPNIPLLSSTSTSTTPCWKSTFSQSTRQLAKAQPSPIWLDDLLACLVALVENKLKYSLLHSHRYYAAGSPLHTPNSDATPAIGMVTRPGRAAVVMPIASFCYGPLFDESCSHQSTLTSRQAGRLVEAKKR